METIHEVKLESPVMVGAEHQKAMLQTRHVPDWNNIGRSMAPISPMSPADSLSSYSSTSPTLTASVARKPSQIMRGWVKRSGSGRNSSSKPTANPSMPGPSHQRIPIVHLGGGRVGESDIEPTIPTGLRSTTRKPSLERANSADSRVTQWIDLYPEAIERITQSKKEARRQENRHQTSDPVPASREPRWKPQPDHHDAAPSEIDPRPAPLRIPSATKRLEESKKEKSNTSLARSDSKWKPLPVLPVQQQTALTNKPGGNGIPARKPLQSPPPAVLLPEKEVVRIATPKTPPRQTASPVSTTKPAPGQLQPLTIYVTPPTTPESETGGSPTVEQVPKLTSLSGPPPLRINTKTNPVGTVTPIETTITTTTTTATTTNLAAEDINLINLSSPMTLSDSILSTEMDNAIKITIGMMCVDDPAGTSKPVPLDLDSPLASISTLFTPQPLILPPSASSGATNSAALPKLASRTTPSPNTQTAKPPPNTIITSPTDTLASTGGTPSNIRYTRKERMWLHQHYRGETPFLRAWGLDIKSEGDREEGVEILRELMGMDGEGGEI